MNMTLGGYSFPWLPDRWTMPKAEKFSGRLLTYSAAAFFSFGTSIIGKEIILEWDLMGVAQFNEINTQYLADTQKNWNPGTGNQYTVELVNLDAEYVETVAYDYAYYKNVKLLLMIMALA
jgi:hypothetical protein